MTRLMQPLRDRVRIAILGGGISGCAMAAELGRDERVEVVLFERAPRLGGLHRSARVGAYVFDIGAFAFSDDHAIFSVFPEVRELFPRVANRYGSIRPGGFLDDYPLTIAGIRRQFGTPFLIRALLEALAMKIHRLPRRSVREFSEYYLGPTLYRASGLQHYIERLYLASDTEIELEFAEKRLGAIALSASVRRLLSRLAAAMLAGRDPTSALQPLTAGEIRVRPEAGFDEVYARITSSLLDRHVELHCNCSIERIVRSDAGYRFHGAGDDRTFDGVFSTIPVEVMARLLGLEEIIAPRYMDLYSLFYECSGPLPFPHNVLHNFTQDGQWKRLTMLSRYYGPIDGKHFFTVEGTAPQGRDHEALLLCGKEDFERWTREQGMLVPGLRFLDGIVTPRGYPVYQTRTARAVQQLKHRLTKAGVVLVGRQGSFDYLSSSDAADNARAAARQFLAGLDVRSQNLREAIPLAGQAR